jgi:hypothetical protein
MSYQIKLRQLLSIIIISAHRLAPKLEVVQEIVYALLRRYRFPWIIIWPGAASHTNEIHHYHTEISCELLNDFKIQWS